MKLLAGIVLSLAVSAPAFGQDIVLARNAWTTVTKSDFEAEIARLPITEQFTFRASAERVARTVEAILVNKTLAAQARAGKLDETPAVKAEAAAAAERILARHQLMHAESELKAPDFSKRAEELYKANRGKYAEKDVYHTMHVLVDAKCRTLEVAKARALEARTELLAGRPFPDIAKKYSDDPSVTKNGGDIGPLTLEGLSPAFAEAVKTMKTGDLSEPVLSNFGYHVIKLEGIKKGRQFSFQEVREGLIRELQEEWLRQRRKEFVERITADPDLKLDLDAIQALKTSIGDAPAPQPPSKR